MLKFALCYQIGPRMTLQLVKIQEGMGEGNIIYHSISESFSLPSSCFWCSGVHDDKNEYETFNDFSLKVNAY